MVQRLASSAPLAMDPEFARQKEREMREKAGLKPKRRPLPKAPSELFPGADPENYPYRLAKGKKRGGTYA